MVSLLRISQTLRELTESKKYNINRNGERELLIYYNEGSRIVLTNRQETKFINKAKSGNRRKDEIDLLLIWNKPPT
jgi:hypothetical protein